MFDPIELAYENGKAAFMKNVLRSNNPYHSCDELADAWRRGWSDAFVETAITTKTKRAYLTSNSELEKIAPMTLD